MNTLIVVTHLLGTGHLARALTLARAFAAAGHRVRTLSGGMPAPHLESDSAGLEQLPPLRSDGVNFTRLLDRDGNDANPRYLAQRVAAMEQAVHAFQPDIVITELFPFGRRVLAPEFLALLTAARAVERQPVILSSIRDILAPPSKPEKAARTDRILAEHYDAVLVHSDPAAVPLDLSWPISDTLGPMLRYTGFVAPGTPGPHPTGAGRGEVLVSAGGGAVGDPLFRAAIGAAHLRPRTRWRLLVGGALSDRIETYRNLATGSSVSVEPVRPDYRQMLTEAAASISFCGYNTALDILATGVPAVLTPFDAGQEVEQTLRVRALSGLPGIAAVGSAELSAETLAGALDKVLAEGRQQHVTDLDGATRTVEIAADLARSRRS